MLLLAQKIITYHQEKLLKTYRKFFYVIKEKIYNPKEIRTKNKKWITKENKNANKAIFNSDLTRNSSDYYKIPLFIYLPAKIKIITTEDIHSLKNQ